MSKQPEAITKDSTCWRDYVTDNERDKMNAWSRWGITCITKTGRKWDSLVPDAPLFTTKTAAYDALTEFVCEVIPKRCQERMMAKEYRCTRPEVYPEGSPGFTDPSARQGYYITANSEEEAREKMKTKFPRETRFDIRLWKEREGKP